MKKATIAASELSKRNMFSSYVATKRNSIIEIIAALFILMFLYTALSKSIVISNTENLLKITPWLSHYASELAWTVVIVEYLIAALLFIPRTRLKGLYASLILMTVFTCYIIYMKALVTDLPCSCGGVVSKMTWNQHLAFNIFFILLSIVGIVLLKSNFNSKNQKDSTPVIFT